MTPETRKHAGILIVIIPTVVYGGVSILGFLIHDPAYMQNPLRQNLFRSRPCTRRCIADPFPGFLSIC